MAKILLIGRKGDSTSAMFNHLFLGNDVQVLLENKEKRLVFLKRRIKRLGLLTTLGQIFFALFVKIYLKPISARLKLNVVKKYNLNLEAVPENLVQSVNSVNSPDARRYIINAAADVILVSGTRIISKETLRCVEVPFINVHAGITPAYRGVHGCYWAKVNGEVDLCGVTLHFLDEGVDTGGVIGHSLVVTEEKHNFILYPLVQLAKGLEMLDVYLKGGNLHVIREYNSEPLLSNQYYHPTIWTYFHFWIKKGIN